jgi:hypothetical protein
MEEKIDTLFNADFRIVLNQISLAAVYSLHGRPINIFTGAKYLSGFKGS